VALGSKQRPFNVITQVNSSRVYDMRTNVNECVMSEEEPIHESMVRREKYDKRKEKKYNRS